MTILTLIQFPPMASTTAVSIRKTTRVRKTSTTASPTIEIPSTISQFPSLKLASEAFITLLEKINQAKEEFEELQKAITEAREAWLKEQRQHEQDVSERKRQEELERKREQEAYEYEATKTRRQAQDEFGERKAKWEKELSERKEEIENDKRELEELREKVASFDAEKEKAIKEACIALQKDLTSKFETERKLREQEFKAEKEMLTLRLEGVTAEGTRQAKEIENLKRALEEATRQIKEIAVKVIESGGSGKIPSQESYKTEK